MAKLTIEMPHVGESVTEAVIGKWLVSPGDSVRRYDPLVEVITDKVNMEVPSPRDGTITDLLVSEDDTVQMGAPIAQMEVEGAAPEPRSIVEPQEDTAASSGSVGASRRPYRLDDYRRKRRSYWWSVHRYQPASRTESRSRGDSLTVTTTPRTPTRARWTRCSNIPSRSTLGRETRLGCQRDKRNWSQRSCHASRR